MKESIKILIRDLDFESISEERYTVLNSLVSYLKESEIQKKVPKLNFICTHNSRRSQFSQLWCTVMSHFYTFPVECFSGGTAVTACNERTVGSLKRFGFDIESTNNEENPIYVASISEEIQLENQIFNCFLQVQEAERPARLDHPRRSARPSPRRLRLQRCGAPFSSPPRPSTPHRPPLLVQQQPRPPEPSRASGRPALHPARLMRNQARPAPIGTFAR